MGMPAAKLGDKVVAIDTHIVLVQAGPAKVPTPLPHPFNGILNAGLSANVNIMGLPAATVGSMADNVPKHVATKPGLQFVNNPTNKATIQLGSPTVFINAKPAARAGDVALTCNDPTPAPKGRVVAAGTVFFG